MSLQSNNVLSIDELLDTTSEEFGVNSDAIDMLHLSSDLLNENVIKQQLKLLDENLDNYDIQPHLLSKKQRECKESLVKAEYFKDLEYFESDDDEGDPNDLDRPSNETEEIFHISELSYPNISRYFKNWIGKVICDNHRVHNCVLKHQTDEEIPSIKCLLDQLEVHLTVVEEGIISGQLYKDTKRRKFLFVQLALTLHDIHRRLFSFEICIENNSTSNVNQTRAGAKRTNIDKFSGRSSKRMKTNVNPVRKLDQKCDKDQSDNIIALGTIFLRMCYPPDAPQQSNEYIKDLREKINAQQQINVDTFITNDLPLLILLLGCSEDRLHRRIYLYIGLCSVCHWYNKLSGLGKRSTSAVSCALDIANDRLFGFIRKCKTNQLLPLFLSQKTKKR